MSEQMKAQLEAAKATMGDTYLLHPANQVKRKTPFRKSVKQLRDGLRSSAWVTTR